MAERLLREANDSDTRLLHRAARLALGRSLGDREMRIALESKSRLAVFFEQNQDEAAKLIAVGDTAPTNDLPAATLATWTLVCNQFLNLDEALTK